MAEPRFIPHGARCEALQSFPDDNVAACGEYANRQVRGPDGRERYVCNGHGHDLPTIEDQPSTSEVQRPNTDDHSDTIGALEGPHATS